MFEKVLVANRGEIAVRVMRTLRELEITSVAVFSEADRASLHVRYADEAYCIGPAPSNESYLCIDKIIETALAAGADAVHPGYGFLSERAPFAQAVIDAGMTWVGPPAGAIEAMGDKIRARTLMTEAGVPVVPGVNETLENTESALEAAREIGFPVLIKAAAGGGGKGMRRVDTEEAFEEAFTGASREAASAFGRGDCYIEKFLINPRHVEIQVLGDTHGNVLHLFERDCSLQRRHQKVVEETPCPILRQDVREHMGEVAVRAAAAVNYEGAGTVEFLLDADQSFYFLEMNTRLQVEHPVTEWVTGLDLVALQLDIANGDPIPFAQSEIEARGASIEVRVYAEDPANNFLPSPGTITRLQLPHGPGVRVDSGVYEGCAVPMFYDPLLLKLTTWGDTRKLALSRLERALSELLLRGIRDTTGFLRRAIRHPEFESGEYDIGFIGRYLDELTKKTENPEILEVARLAGVAAAFERDESRAGSTGASPGTAEPKSLWRDDGRRRQLGG